LFQIRSWINCFETNFPVKNITHDLSSAVINANMHFQFLKRTFHRLLVLLITGLTLYWKYHAPDESKLLYRGCMASFENRKFCIKLSKLCINWLSKIQQSRKNIDISVLSGFFRYRFSFFFQLPQQPNPIL
jgi:hypothetical protein